MKTLRILLLLVLSAAPAWAQPTVVSRRPVEAIPTNAVAESQELTITNDLTTAEELSDTNEAAVVETNSPAEKGSLTNTSPTAPPRDGRRSRELFDQRKAAHANRAASASADTAPPAEGPAKVDFSAFSRIVELNIFDPNRRPRKTIIEAPPPATESFALVGTMTYGKGTFAFFKGTSSRYEKALKLSDSIAGYKLTAIAPNSVKLASATNVLDLPIGSQMRRVEDGPWKLSSDSVPFIASSGSTTSAGSSTQTDSASSGSESEILKKLKQRREQE